MLRDIFTVTKRKAGPHASQASRQQLEKPFTTTSVIGQEQHMAISQVLQIRNQLDDPPSFLEAIGDEYKLSFVAAGLQSLVQDGAW